MKAYVCDSCGTAMINPFMANMREFRVEHREMFFPCCFGGVAIPKYVDTEKTVHLCDKCFKGLRKIARKFNG